MKDDIRQTRQFGITLSIALIIIGCILIFRKSYINLWLFATAFIIFVISLVSPKILKPIYRVWMGITSTIGKIISFVILGLFFYLVITPVGLFMKILRRDSLHRSFDKNTQTYWVKRDNRLSDPKRIERQF